jgi:hypothetical protein
VVKYPKEVKEKALARMMAPNDEPVAKLSRELKVALSEAELGEY